MANQFIQFMNKSRSAFAAVATVKEELIGAGFKQLSEKESWAAKLSPNGRYFFTRNDSTIAAFIVGGKVSRSQPPAFVVSAAHTDSPCLKVKPVSTIEKHGTVQIGVETYGTC
jgi:aspartyl aminopeptidase